MRIYFVVKEPSQQPDNHYVYSLGSALQKHGCEVAYGLWILWDNEEVLQCDVVHFQWPEGIFGLFSHKVTDKELLCITERLAWLKGHGKRIFITCHNLKPHTNRDTNVLHLYDILYNQADVIQHLGAYSYNLLHSQYPKAWHVVIPHHHYDNVYSFSISREEARQRLKLPPDQKIVLSFGKFRNRQERHFILYLRQQCDSILFLMPGFYRKTLHTWNPRKLITRICHTLYYKLKGINFSNDVIPDDLMQCYFCAADVVLIQRLDILNSGNLPMAFAAGKVVVGPDMGNVGQILRETNNFVFDPKNANTAVDALYEALSVTTKGKENMAYAMKYWSSDTIAVELLKYYKG